MTMLTADPQKLLLLCTLFITAIARCPNWCNRRGICTSPAEGGYCVCDKVRSLRYSFRHPSFHSFISFYITQQGFTGEDCSKSWCPHGFDPFTPESILQNKTIRKTVRLETGVVSGQLSGQVRMHIPHLQPAASY